MKVLIDDVEYVPKPDALPQTADVYDRALALAPHGDDTEERTLRGYLKALLLGVWEEQEGFDGKRPFGSSGWGYDLIIPLVDGGFVPGKTRYDEDHCLVGYEVDEVAASEFVSHMIEHLFKEPGL